MRIYLKKKTGWITTSIKWEPPTVTPFSSSALNLKVRNQTSFWDLFGYLMFPPENQWGRIVLHMVTGRPNDIASLYDEQNGTRPRFIHLNNLVFV